jgi:hypothetical protein
MSPAFLLRLLLSALGFLCLALLLLQALSIQARSELPMRAEMIPERGYVLRARAGRDVPPPFQEGDILVLKDIAAADRAAIFSGTGIPPDVQVDLVAVRDGQLIRGSVRSSVIAPSGLARLQLWIGGFFGMSFVCVLALLTLWRGRDWGAWGLAGFSLALLFENGLFVVIAHPPANFWVQQTREALLTLVAFPALYVMAESVARAGISAQTRRIMRISVVLLAVIAFGTSLGREVALIYYGKALPPATEVAGTVAVTALNALAVLVLLRGYRRAGHESKLRIRWILCSTAVLLATVVVFAAISAPRHPYLYPLVNVAQGFALLGYLYAVLRTRLVDVSFVIDRALVFTVITALLFGIFALLEQTLHHFAVGDGLSSALQALTALLLAIGLSPVHRRLEHWIETLFFRRQRLAVAQLEGFARECAFIEHEESLLQAALTHLLRQCSAVAIYERLPSAYELRASQDPSWPARIHVDDVVFVSLRAQRRHIDLDGAASALGSEGVAFPMAVAETLTGAVVCRPRAAEQFAPDVRAALDEVARNLGMSLYLLRHRNQSRLLRDIAAGRFDEAAARARALALIGDVR